MNIDQKMGGIVPPDNHEFTFQNMSNPQIAQSCKPELEIQQKRCHLSKGEKIGCLFAFTLICLIIGLSLGLTTGSRTSLSQTSPTTIAEWDDGRQMIYSDFQMKKQKFFIEQPLISDDDSTDSEKKQPLYKIIIAKMRKQLNEKKRFLQQETDDSDSYITYVNLDQMGLSFAVTPNNNIQVTVQTKAFQDYVYSQLHQEDQRLLMFTPDPFQLANAQDIKQQLSTILGLEFDSGQAVELRQTQIVQYVLDSQTSKFWPKPQSLSRLLTEILLPEQQQKTSKKDIPRFAIKKFIPQIIKLKIQKIIVNVLKEVKQHGKEIAVAAGQLSGAIAGGIYGIQSGLLGIIAGAIAGQQSGKALGQMIGKNTQKLASAALLACVPHNSVTIKCSKNTLTQNITGKVNNSDTGSSVVNNLANGFIGFISLSGK